MTARKVQMIAFMAFLSCFEQRGLAWFPETEYAATRQFLACLGVALDSAGAQTNSWTEPIVFASQGGNTNLVHVEKTVAIPSGIRHVVRCSYSNESASASVNICTNQVSAMMELCLPCVAFSSAPVDMIASTYSITNAANGITCIMRNGDEQETALLAYHNISIRFQGADPYNRAVALLRAGGVAIPDEPVPQNPDPEPGD